MTSRKPAGPGTFTKVALAAKAAQKAAHQVQLKKAVALVAAGEGGAGKVSRMVEGCTKSQVATAIAHASSKRPWRAAWDIMTGIEEERLVKWMDHGERGK
jgi:hypothetical protein